jgi:hypothetical protein
MKFIACKDSTRREEKQEKRSFFAFYSLGLCRQMLGLRIYLLGLANYLLGL